jgi:hypothetical protein
VLTWPLVDTRSVETRISFELFFRGEERIACTKKKEEGVKNISKRRRRKRRRRGRDRQNMMYM